MNAMIFNRVITSCKWSGHWKSKPIRIKLLEIKLEF